ncbi:GNAT family N-acetyltransferase [Paenibacillus antarcticus]|uniref:N-acetyltransferase domain-containing protein n=1 Tax=Paenibacillus antarcticus TaxID=253703 RepID=A0A168PSY0_9BACL|nr:GNAT family protein [Paenibacillus antarcticus]OAB47042.1 hypothetical protein PBAT_08270 [Paenibacillus antarcticus]
MQVEKLFNEMPVFETERLLLRKLSLDDIQDYYEFASDPIVSANTLWDRHESLEDTIKDLEYATAKYESRQAYRWGIVYKPLNKLVGRTGLISWDVRHQRAEIGFALSSQYWNKGIMTEATREVITYSFEQLDVNRLEGRCNYNNIGSARVLENVGMKFEGILRQQLKIKGEFIDQKMYAVLKSDCN